MHVTRVGIDYQLLQVSVDQRTVKKYVKIKPKVLGISEIREENRIMLTEILNLTKAEKEDQRNT